jgi:glycosyltransferase 2 family protein
MSRSTKEMPSGSPESMPTRRGLSKRSLLIGAAIGFPASAILLLLSLGSLDTAALGDSVRGASPSALALAVCASSLVYVVQALRWRLVARAEPSPSFARFLDWAIGAVAVNNVVPGRPGDVLRIEWLSRGARMPRTRALASVIVDRGLDLVVLLAAFAVAYPAVEHAAWLERVGLGALVVAGIGGIVVAGAALFARRVKPEATSRVARLVADVTREARMRLRGWRGLAAVALSVLAWSTWALSAWLVASSLGLSLSVVDLVVVTAVINVGVAIPSSPGFIGTYQWLGVSALALLGVDHTQAFAFAVLMHAAWFVPTTLAGAVLVLRKLPPVIAVALGNRQSQSNVA